MATSCCAHRTLGALPTELLEGILSHLCRHDLAQCILVCRLWENALTPYLWRTFGSLSCAQRGRFISDETTRALARNAIFVHRLCIDDEELYDRLLPSCTPYHSEIGVAVPAHTSTMSPFTNLRFLELHLVNDSDKFSQRIVALVRHNPDLQCLLVRVYRHLPDNADYDFDGPYKRRESHFRSSLARPAKTRLPIVHFEDFHLAPLQNVYSVSFGKNAADHEASRVDPYHKFDYLHIDGDLQKLEESVLVPFLKGCDSGSRYVPCLGTVFQNQPEIVGALLETGFALKVLHFERFLFNDDLVAIISSSSQWTNIWLETSAVAGCVADAIVENCANLEALEIMYSVDSGYETTAYGMNGPRMQAILSKASHLKTLLAHWIVNVDDKMTSRDILSSEWATTSLEHVDFKIAVPRADDDESTVRITIESSHAIQRQILRRLGQQKNLRKLVLGGAVISTTTGELGWHNSCLEMTLESGLDELAGLKSLEELNIRDMDHLMNEPEIKWMAENLPKLARVKGLFDNDHPPRELKDWISAHKPGWEV